MLKNLEMSEGMMEKVAIYINFIIAPIFLVYHYDLLILGVKHAVMQTLNLLARILDPNRKMKSKVSCLLLATYCESLYFSICLPGFLMHCSFMVDQLMDLKRNWMQQEAMMILLDQLEKFMKCQSQNKIQGNPFLFFSVFCMLFQKSTLSFLHHSFLACLYKNVLFG